MIPALILCFVLLGTYGVVSVFLCGLLALIWGAGLSRAPATAFDLLTLRLVPAAGGMLLTLTVVLPAFLMDEPPQQRELAGPVLVSVAMLAVLCLIHGVWRGWRACSKVNALLMHDGVRDLRIIENGREVHMLDVAEPLTAVVGVWHPRIVTSKSVRCACSPEEFRQVIAHEAAHIQTYDNLKLLLLLAAPDVLAWTRLGATLTENWRGTAEREADRRATGEDPQRRLALASALIKVGRLLADGRRADHVPSMPAALDDVPGRVRELLGPPVPSYRSRIARALLCCALLIPVLALPLHAFLHEMVEFLVRLRPG